MHRKDAIALAAIVLGLGISHSPQVSLPPDTWAAYAARDPNTFFPLLYKRKVWQYDDLVRARADQGIAERINEESFAALYDRVQVGVAELASALKQARPDVLVVIGDDHHEVYSADSMPTFAVYWGSDVDSIPPTDIFPAVRPAAWALFGEKPETYPCHGKLGEHMIIEMNRVGFDVAQLARQPDGVSVGHPFIMVRTRLMDPDAPLTPMVPVLVNTYFPPNRPTPWRCWDFGKALRSVIESFPEDLRVAVIASGGLSHFVVDEDIDRALLAAMQEGDEKKVAALEPEDFESGTSESLCWLVAGGACTHLNMTVVEYAPGYRTAGGTGCAMTMVRWS
jgi:3-O-methylgallate 3,4-dioxygenase